MSALKVLVYGATGSQAGPIVPKLLASGHQPYVVTRSAAKAEALAGAGAQVVEADMGNAGRLTAITAGMDVVALTVPAFNPDPTDHGRFFHNALEAARAAGVKLLVYNTSGPVIRERTGNPQYDMRLDLLAALQASGVPSIVIQPTVYLENLLGPWTRPGVIERDELAYPVEEHQRLGWIATDDVAAFVAAAVERPQLAGEHFIVSGEENLTGPELAERFSRGLGRTISYRAMPLEEFGAVLDTVFGPGAGAGGIAGYKFQRERADIIPTWNDMRPVLERLPIRMTSVEEWAARMQPAFAQPLVRQL
jgi:uncharacterized protein YbjT (DUF2867 family)